MKQQLNLFERSAWPEQPLSSLASQILESLSLDGLDLSPKLPTKVHVYPHVREQKRLIGSRTKATE